MDGKNIVYNNFDFGNYLWGNVLSTPKHPEIFHITRDAFCNNIVYTANNNDPYGIEFVHNPEGYIRHYGPAEHYHFYYIKDLLGNIRETYVHPEADYKECVERTQYYPSGLPWVERQTDSFTANPWKYNGKEFIEMHSLDEYDSKARWYYPAICRTTTMDPLAEKYYSTSPYAWCGNNFVKNVDLDGRRPVYNTNGDFLGTDDEGLQGDAIIMSDDYFQQGMSSSEALLYHMEESGFVDEKAQEKFIQHYSQLNTRPDWDGYLTLSEANDWYRNGQGEPLFTDLKQIDISRISLNNLNVGERKPINLLYQGNSLNDRLVYGNITFEMHPSNTITVLPDKYDFEMHSGYSLSTMIRNTLTIIGGMLAGKGTPYQINVYGNQHVRSTLP